MSQTAGTVVGTVYLVGGGPGAPGLLTARAAQVLASADVIVYDRLISPRLLSIASTAAEFVYVGKEAGHHTMKQDAINGLLIEYALQGKQVVRLKGGDPFVFGRGGEEALACRRAGVPFEVVPGVTYLELCYSFHHHIFTPDSSGCQSKSTAIHGLRNFALPIRESGQDVYE